MIRRVAESMGARVAVCTHFTDGGAGADELADAVVEACDEPSAFHFLYPDDASLVEKIETVATKVYGAGRVEYLPAAARQLARRTSATASATCRCASPRPTCRSPPTPR